jgi:hypothetical protein
MHKLVGYDRVTEWVSDEIDLSPQDFDDVKRIVGITASDPDGIGCYPLSPPTAQEVGRKLGRILDTRRMDFFLEPAPAP